MPKKTASKQDWIKLGFKLFSHNGANALVIEKMAKRLTVSKTSFYNYFKTKDLFIQEIIQFWQGTQTENIILETEKSTTPAKALRNLMHIALTADPSDNFSIFLRQYGEKHPHFLAMAIDTDKRRLTYIETLLINLGINANDAQAKSEIIYNYRLGLRERSKGAPLNKEQSHYHINLLAKYLNIPQIRVDE